MLECSRVLNVWQQGCPLGAARQLLKRIPRDDMAADEAHWWVTVGALLAQYGTRKH